MDTAPGGHELARALMSALPSTLRPRHDGRVWTLHSSELDDDVAMILDGDDLADWVQREEKSGYEILGVSPAWKSAVGMISVYIPEQLFHAEDVTRQSLAYDAGGLRIVDKPR